MLVHERAQFRFCLCYFLAVRDHEQVNEAFAVPVFAFIKWKDYMNCIVFVVEISTYCLQQCLAQSGHINQ